MLQPATPGDTCYGLDRESVYRGCKMDSTVDNLREIGSYFETAVVLAGLVSAGLFQFLEKKRGMFTRLFVQSYAGTLMRPRECRGKKSWSPTCVASSI